MPVQKQIICLKNEHIDIWVLKTEILLVICVQKSYAFRMNTLFATALQHQRLQF